LSRMHWANSNAASCAGWLAGGADALAALNVASTAVAPANAATNRDALDMDPPQ
jgi:hypothetical protein